MRGFSTVSQIWLFLSNCLKEVLWTYIFLLFSFWVSLFLENRKLKKKKNLYSILFFFFFGIISPEKAPWFIKSMGTSEHQERTWLHAWGVSWQQAYQRDEVFVHRCLGVRWHQLWKFHLALVGTFENVHEQVHIWVLNWFWRSQFW